MKAIVNHKVLYLAQVAGGEGGFIKLHTEDGMLKDAMTCPVEIRMSVDCWPITNRTESLQRRIKEVIGAGMQQLVEDLQEAIEHEGVDCGGCSESEESGGGHEGGPAGYGED